MEIGPDIARRKGIMDWGTKEYREGYRAYVEDYPLGNPYTDGTGEAQEFYLGYMRAKIDTDQSKVQEGPSLCMICNWAGVPESSLDGVLMCANCHAEVLMRAKGEELSPFQSIAAGLKEAIEHAKDKGETK